MHVCKVKHFFALKQVTTLRQGDVSLETIRLAKMGIETTIVDVKKIAELKAPTRFLESIATSVTRRSEKKRTKLCPKMYRPKWSPTK
jgi:hypothetical protein